MQPILSFQMQTARRQKTKLGDRLSIQSAIKNNGEIEQEFVYIVQAQDSAGYVVFLA
jgi:hypothetical protein